MSRGYQPIANRPTNAVPTNPPQDTGIVSTRDVPVGDPPLEGCGEHSCVIAKVKGQGCNARCRCPEQKLRHAVLLLKNQIEILQIELRAARGDR